MKLNRQKYSVTLQGKTTGERHDRIVIAKDAESAKAVAVQKALREHSAIVAKEFENYEVVACEEQP